MEEDITPSSKPAVPDMSVTLSTYKILLGFSIIMLALIIGNLLIACRTNFNCTIFLPSPGYLGCFRGHDRLFISGCTLYGWTLPLLYSSAYIQFRPRFSLLEKNLFLILSFTSSSSLPVLALSNEVIGVHWIPVTTIYSFSSSLFLISTLMLTCMLYKQINNLRDSLKDTEKKWFWALRVTLVLIILLGIGAVIAWKYSYSSLNNKLFNQNIQSLCEWGVTFLSIILPPTFAQFFRNSNLSFVKSSTSSYDTNLDSENKIEIELSDVIN